MLNLHLCSNWREHEERTWEAAKSFLHRLGRDQKIDDVDGYASTITAAAADASGSRLAWVESREKETPHKWDVSHVLRVSRMENEIATWDIPTYNPFFGCTVGLLRWYGNSIAIVYREKHEALLGIYDLASNSASLLPLHDDWREETDVIYYQSKEPNLIETCSLPDMRVGVPIPTGISAEVQRFVRRPAITPDAFSASVAARLFGDAAPQPLADLLIGASCFRFWDNLPKPVNSYRSLSRRWNSPFWLPLYWYQSIGEPDKAAMLNTLETLASKRMTVGCADSFAFDMAAVHVCRSAEMWAGACKQGAIPKGTWCHFWLDWTQRLFKRSINLFPGGFREAYEQLSIAPKPRGLGLFEHLFRK